MPSPKRSQRQAQQAYEQSVDAMQEVLLPSLGQVLATGRSLRECAANVAAQRLRNALLDEDSLAEMPYDLMARRWSVTFKVKGHEHTTFRASGSVKEGVWQARDFGVLRPPVPRIRRLVQQAVPAAYIALAAAGSLYAVALAQGWCHVPGLK